MIRWNLNFFKIDIEILGRFLMFCFLVFKAFHHHPKYYGKGNE